MHRFFVPPESIEEDRVSVAGPVARRMGKALAVGDRAIILDNSGWEREVEVSAVEEGQVTGHVVRKSLVAGEPRTKISLYQGILKGKRFKFVLQKGTELGVVEFVPLICDRCLIAHLGDISARRLRRWRMVILEAAERSGRGRLPSLQPAMIFSQACEQASRKGLSIIPWEGEKSVSLRALLRRGEGKLKGNPSPSAPHKKPSPFSINIFIGPEEGFSPEEMKQAQSYGVLPVTLGPRALHVETVGIVAATAILYELGDLG